MEYASFVLFDQIIYLPNDSTFTKHEFSKGALEVTLNDYPGVPLPITEDFSNFNAFNDALEVENHCNSLKSTKYHSRS